MEHLVFGDAVRVLTPTARPFGVPGVEPGGAGSRDGGGRQVS